MIDVWLFLTMAWVCLQFVIVFYSLIILFRLFLFMLILPVPSLCLVCGSMINLHENMRTGQGQTHDPLLTSLQGVIRGPTLFLH